ncbi:MAG: site-specific integrase [Lachnospiraceae bacterium]|nr:site-specific integrase [Lachnospiraceae bacterium]
MKTVAIKNRETHSEAAQSAAALHDTKQSTHDTKQSTHGAKESTHGTKQRMSAFVIWLTAVGSVIAAHSVLHVGVARLTDRDIDAFLSDLKGKGRADNTVDQYTHHMLKLQSWLDDRPVTSQRLIEWRNELSASYAVASVNNFISAVNSFICFKKSENSHSRAWNSIGCIPHLSVQKKIL